MMLSNFEKAETFVIGTAMLKVTHGQTQTQGEIHKMTTFFRQTKILTHRMEDRRHREQERENSNLD